MIFLFRFKLFFYHYEDSFSKKFFIKQVLHCSNFERQRFLQTPMQSKELYFQLLSLWSSILSLFIQSEVKI